MSFGFPILLLSLLANGQPQPTEPRVDDDMLVGPAEEISATPKPALPEFDVEFELADTLIESIADACSQQLDVERAVLSRAERFESLSRYRYQLDTMHRSFSANYTNIGLVFYHGQTNALREGASEDSRPAAKTEYVDYGLMRFALDYKNCADLALSPVGFAYLHKLPAFDNAKRAKRAALESEFDSYHSFKGEPLILQIEPSK
ncbi:hypothetical protein [Sphingorhabdus sp. Alg231-15]|uniref:hypothetical protein n=1 Tax=Sphingorhabdus sp. Alg231-15 TaxID=1922222 RepID=UPI000D5549EE